MKRKIKTMLLTVLGAGVAVSALAFAACTDLETPPEDLAALSVPLKLAYNKDEWKLTWRSVANAESYVVRFAGEELGTQDNFLDLTYSLSPDETYLIQVMAVGDGKEYGNSAWSNGIIATTVSSTKNLSYTLLEDGSGYAVSRDSENKELSGIVVMPDYYEGLPVTAVAEDGFYPVMDDLLITNFYDEKIKGVRFPSHLKEIGEDAFYNCSAITSVKIPESVVKIGKGSFSGCLSLSEVTLPEGLTEIESEAFLNTAIETIELPANLVRIGEMAFSWTKLSQIQLPETLTTIEEEAFSFCKMLKKIEIPKGITEIVGYTFLGCSQLTEVVFPEGLVSIGSRAFGWCSALAQVDLPRSLTNLGAYAFEGTAWFNSQPKGFVTLRGDILYCYNGDETVIKEFPANIKYIAGGAFSNLSVTEVAIPDGITLCSTDYLFEGCKSLVSCTLPDELTEFGMYMFYSCASLETISFPSGLVSIGDSAFSGCSSLKIAAIPEGVVSIGRSAFYDCGSITEMTLPSSLTSIGEGAFIRCASLKSVVLPKGLFLQTSLFAQCSSLSAIYFCGTEAEWETAAENFSTSSGATVYYYSESQPAAESKYWRYVDGQPCVWDQGIGN